MAGTGPGVLAALLQEAVLPAPGSHRRAVLQPPHPAKLAPGSAGSAGLVPSFPPSGALAVSW